MKKYYYANPTGNITILAQLPPEDISLTEAAAQLMAAEPAAEQVGFLSGGGEGWDISLQMAGGEFCGNATLSAAAVFALNRSPAFSDPLREDLVKVRVTGVRDPVPVSLKQTGAKTFSGRVRMPSPLEIRTMSLEWNGSTFSFPVVRFPGITHLISEIPLDQALAESAIKKWCADLDADAMGIMQVDTGNQTLAPLVYVRSGETLFWERSCASGTAAAGAYLRLKSGPGEWTFSEPAGVLKIRAAEDGSLVLTGNVILELKKSGEVQENSFS